MTKRNTATINDIIKSIVGSNEDAIQQTWLEILEAKASQTEQIKSIARMVYMRHHRDENKIHHMLRFEEEAYPYSDSKVTYHDTIPDPKSVPQYASELRAEEHKHLHKVGIYRGVCKRCHLADLLINGICETCWRKKLNKVVEKFVLPEEMKKDLDNDAIAHKFAQERGYYPISRQHLSAEYVDIVSKPHCRGRPRIGEWKRCVICNRAFYVRPSRKDHAYTCRRSCANKILGKFRWLKSDKHFGMTDEAATEYISNLLPFPEERNKEAWEHYFYEAFMLIAEGEAQELDANTLRKAIARLITRYRTQYEDERIYDIGARLACFFLKENPKGTLEYLFADANRPFTPEEIVNCAAISCAMEILKQEELAREIQPGVWEIKPQRVG